MKAIILLAYITLMVSCSHSKITNKTTDHDIVFTANISTTDRRTNMCGMEFSDNGNKLLIWNQENICEYVVVNELAILNNCQILHPALQWENESIHSIRYANPTDKATQQIRVVNANSRFIPLYENLHVISNDFSLLRESIAREKRARQETIPPLLRFQEANTNIHAYGCLLNESNIPGYVASICSDSQYSINPQLYNNQGDCRLLSNLSPSFSSTSLNNEIIAFASRNMSNHVTFHVFRKSREFFVLREQDAMQKQTQIGRSDDNYAYISSTGKYAILVFNLAHARNFNIGGFHGCTLSNGYNITYVVDLENGQKYRLNNTDDSEYFIAAIDENNKRIAFWDPETKQVRITNMNFE